MKSEKIILIYISKKDTTLEDVEFYAWLKYLENFGLDYEFHTIIAEEPIHYDQGSFEGRFVYLNIPTVTLLPKIKNFLRVLKEKNCFLIAGGGLDVAIHYQEIFEKFQEIDAVITNPEIEKVLEQLGEKNIDNIKRGQLQGIAYQNRVTEEIFKNNSDLTLSENLDHLSSIELFEHWNPKRTWYPIIVSRGCQYGCLYCGFHLFYSRSFKNDMDFLRVKSVKKVVDEIAFLYSKGITKFAFYCHQFLIRNNKDDRYIANLGEEIINRNLEIKFRFSVKPSLLLENIDQMNILIEAGLDIVDLGIDSGIPRFHEMYRTGSTVQDCIEALRYMSDNNLTFDTGFIFYDPYLTTEEMRENLLFLEKAMSYYSHLQKPFSAYLDSYILNTTLILRYGMPIIEKLRADNLLFEEPGFVSNPIAKFGNSDVIYIYSVYRAVNEILLRKIRHLFYDKEIVREYPFINRFPLTIYEEILSVVRARKYGEIKEGAYYIMDFIKDFLKPYMREILSGFPKYRGAGLNAIFNLNE